MSEPGDRKGRGKIEVEDNPYKKVIDFKIGPGGSTVETATIDWEAMGENRETIMRAKPKVPPLEDQYWFMLVGGYGVKKALTKMFIEYYTRTNSSPPRERKKDGHAKLGEVGDTLWSEAGQDWGQFVALARAYDFNDLTKLGKFGIWFREAGLDIALLKDVIITYLEN